VLAASPGAALSTRLSGDSPRRPPRRGASRDLLFLLFSLEETEARLVYGREGSRAEVSRRAGAFGYSLGRARESRTGEKFRRVGGE